MWNKSTFVLGVLLGVCQCWDRVHLNRINFSPMYVGECGEIYVTDKVVIESPGYPTKYPPNTHCEYIMWSPCPTNFHIQFNEFDMEASHLCHKDQLRISRDGEDIHLCGRVVGATTYRSVEGVMKLNFITDNAIEYMGFRLLITRDSCHSGSVNGTIGGGNFAAAAATLSPPPNTAWNSLRNGQEGGERAITIQYEDNGKDVTDVKLFINTEWNHENDPVHVEAPHKGYERASHVQCNAHGGGHPSNSAWNFPQETSVVPIGGTKFIVQNASSSAQRQDDSSSHLPQLYPQPYPPSQLYPQPFPPPVLYPPNCCRSSPLNRPRFLISSPNFPQKNINNIDCTYVIERLVTSCRLRIIFRYFLLPDVDQNFCINTFVEIDGRRFCGCRSGVLYLSQWGLENRKLIRFRHSQIPIPTSIVEGFVMEVIQEECPYRLLRSTPKNDTHPHGRLDFRPIGSSPNTPPPTPPSSQHGESFPNRDTEEKDENTDYEPSMKFFFPNTANRCYFGWLQWFQLTVNPLWITRPQCRL
ncbi:uncharacterized protein LOC129791400 [Lutzomyia longipalpis]|uniref:uncharacterized protein LOC129791400 n=1 Tax=Lutzomyia longipalpis TaxID=7200 RepID=UPI0024846B57|nr:uncharacterized protein LOC129791400 [Lutzomyia longipalpis]